MAVKMAGLMADTWLDKIVDLMTDCWVGGMFVSMAVLRTSWMPAKIFGSMAEDWTDKIVSSMAVCWAETMVVIRAG